MQQLDFFDKDSNLFFFGELEKMRTSIDRQRKAMFAILTELQDEVLKLKEEKQK